MPKPLNATERGFDDTGLSLLIQEGLAVIGHELGNGVSALALRIDLMEGRVPQDEVQALRSITAGFRRQQRVLRLLRASPAGGALHPDAQIEATEWWNLCSGFCMASAPRGTRAVAGVLEGRLSTPQATGLVLIWLACCKDLTSGPATLTLAFSPDHFTISYHPEDPNAKPRDRWAGDMTRYAEALGLGVRWWHEVQSGIWCLTGDL